MENTKRMITIPCGGRPKKNLSAHMVTTLQMQRTTMTVKEMAEFHNVSKSTMDRWLRKVRDMNGEK